MKNTQLLRIEEGYSAVAYHCSEGYVTIGIGQKIGPKGSNLRHYDFTVSESLAESWLNEKLIIIRGELFKLDWFAGLDNDRKIIIESMAYQLGLSGLFKFKKMIAALANRNYRQAANEALDSRWAKQTEARAQRHARVLRGESLDNVYAKIN